MAGDVVHRLVITGPREAVALPARRRNPPPSLSDRELRLTAALYAHRPGVVEHVRATGRLPQEIATGGAEIGLKLLIRRRGVDITLTDDEQLVFDAILREGRLPGGSVRLVDPDDGSSRG
jgi:hypothetical protein